jgi:hypothetical protein
MYGANYGYRSGLNASMVAHLNRKAAAIHAIAGLSPGDLVVDIGSNDSTFLQAMRAPGVDLAGVDPTGAKFRSFYPADIRLIPDFFSSRRFLAEFGTRRARVVTSFSMFYDLEDPLGFMRQVAEVLSGDGIWVFEQSYLPAMLEANSYDTVCHEHIEYYALRQILFMAERAGLKIIDVERNSVNGGSFSLVAARSTSTRPVNGKAIGEMLDAEEAMGLDQIQVWKEFEQRIEAHRRDVREFFEEASATGLEVLGFGASTKGNVLLQYCGLGEKQLPAIVEVNPDKFGAYTPSTKIPIISTEEAAKRNPRAFFVLPWHFREHILAREKEFLGAGGRIVFPLPRLEVVALAKSVSTGC